MGLSLIAGSVLGDPVFQGYSVDAKIVGDLLE
ncbi:hypothetical protein CgS9114_15313 [Corynebacterium glutamicum S9114]|nr:hypothetical protein CgS9114_15313 [Corynebacterium glutamicum S9114]NII88382.1 hypothetical protein [Corynebacterium glutamicum]